jgi:Lipocalin-like domain
MMPSWFSSRYATLVCTAVVVGVALTSSPASAQQFNIKPIAEKKIQQLPPGPLFWRIDSFPALAQAQSAAGPTGLAAEAAGKVWLFTLGPKGGSSPGGVEVAEVGPVPPIMAREYLLRVNLTGGPPGVRTPVHSHPGSESFYVLTGELSQKTPHGISHVGVGQSMPGHGPGLPMEVSSSGTVDLTALVMFLTDASKPFSSPAAMTASGSAGPTAEDMVGTWTLMSDVNTSADGRKVEPFGPHPQGMAIFDRNGRFAIVVSRPDLRKFASDNRMRGAPEENKAIVQGSIGFFGTYSVVDHAVIQHVEGGTWPGWINTDQKRTISSFADDTQTWTTTPSIGGTSELQWQRTK